MKKQPRRLQPISIALSGLVLVSTSLAAWTPSSSSNGTGYSATANAIGFTKAKYDQSGVPVTGEYQTYGSLRAGGNGLIEDGTVYQSMIETAHQFDETLYYTAWSYVREAAVITNNGLGQVNSP